MTLAQKLDRLPPCICRLLAKDKNDELMTDRHLLLVTGWSREKLRRISWARTWDKIGVSDVDQFLTACGLTWSTQRRQLEFLKRAAAKGLDGIRGMKHLRKPTAQRAGVVANLLKRTEAILKNSQ